MKRRAIMRLTYKKLEKLLGLPEDNQILDVISEKQNRTNETVEFKVEGKQLPEKLEGHEISRVPIEDDRFFPGKTLRRQQEHPENYGKRCDVYRKKMSEILIGLSNEKNHKALSIVVDTSILRAEFDKVMNWLDKIYWEKTGEDL